MKKILQKAIEWQRLLDSGEVASRSEIALREGLTPGRITQIMCLIRLAPEIQDHILRMPKCTDSPRLSERTLRHVTQIEDFREQKDAFSSLLESDT